MLLWASFAGVQFGTYEQLRKLDLSGGRNVITTVETSSAKKSSKRKRARTGEDNGDGEVDTYAGGNMGKTKSGRSSAKGVSIFPDAVRHFVCGAVAGGAATVASYPFDITRTAIAYQVRCLRNVARGGHRGKVRCRHQW